MKVLWSFAALVVFSAFFKTAECTISAWSKPVIATATGTGTLDEKINDGVASGTATGITLTATTDGTVSAYAISSQTPTSPALTVSSGGVVTVTSGTVSYTAATLFTLVVTATDGTGTVTATVTLNVNVAPTITSHATNPCIADGSTEGVDLIDLAATDSNSGTTFTWAISTGNTNTDFAVTTNGGVVQVASTKTLAMSTTASYTLVITAHDGSSTPLTATTTVTASVQTTCSSAAAIAVSLMTILAALIVTKLS